MKIKLDENILAALGDCLAGLGHDAQTVISEELVGEAVDAHPGPAKPSVL